MSFLADHADRLNAWLVDWIALGFVNTIALSLVHVRPPTYTGTFNDPVLVAPGRDLLTLETWTELPLVAWLLLALLPCFVALQLRLLARRGQSLGKIVCRVRVIDARDSGKVGFARVVLVRTLFPIALFAVLSRLSFLLGSLAGSLALLMMLADVLWIFGAQRRCLHDYLAGMKVVSLPRRVRARAALPAATRS